MSDMTIQNAIHCMKAMICEEVCEECDYYGKTGTDHCEADAVRMAIKALEEQPHWIPCSERLPDNDTEVFVYLFKHPSPYIAWVTDSHWYTDEFEIEKENEPIAWMSLPKGYKGE